MIEAAIKFATDAHEGQVRKYTGEPYITHPITVSEILAHYHPESTDDMIIAAILHDTVEDTDVTIKDVTEAFTSEVSVLVDWLTDVSLKSDGNRANRKRIDRMHTHRAPVNAQIVKCADIIHNTSDIRENGGSFAEVYLSECRLTAEGMKEEVKKTKIFSKLIEVLG